jgi:hypothetical protein
VTDLVILGGGVLVGLSVAAMIAAFTLARHNRGPR